MATIVGPIALFNNVAIHAEYYKPQRFQISAITLGATTTVTTSVDHDYVVSQAVRLIIPPSFGCRQLNGAIANVLSVPATNQVVLDLYSLGGDQFIASSATTTAQILAVGDINSGPQNTSGRTNLQEFISGSFINVSPAAGGIT